MKEGSLKIIVGRKGSGKTTKSMELIANSNKVLAYDFLNNYEKIEYYKDGQKVTQNGLKLVKGFAELKECYSSRNFLLRFAPPSFDVFSFLDIIKNTKGFVVLMEEATGLFPNGRIPQELILQSQATRHTGNDFIFVFHSLHSVPPQLFTFIDYLYLFKTNDMEKNIKSKFPKLIQTGIYREVNNNENDHYFKLLNKNEIL